MTVLRVSQESSNECPGHAYQEHKLAEQHQQRSRCLHAPVPSSNEAVTAKHIATRAPALSDSQNVRDRYSDYAYNDQNYRSRQDARERINAFAEWALAPPSARSGERLRCHLEGQASSPPPPVYTPITVAGPKR